MNIEKTNYLIEHYPILFERCRTFDGEFEAGDGWFDLVVESLEKIVELNPPEDLKIFCIKEKFGKLVISLDYPYKNNYYINNKSILDKIWAIVEEAERKSINVCEICSSTTSVTIKGQWLKAYCENCRNLNKGKNYG